MPRSHSMASTEGKIFSSMITLALWRWRQNWLLLVITCLGITCAVTILCTAPLLERVTTTAGLRAVLRANPGSSEIVVHANTQGLSTKNIGSIQQQADSVFHQYLGNYLVNGPAQFTLETPAYTYAQAHPIQPRDLIYFFGIQMGPAASHLKLLQGRLPREDVRGNEILLTPVSAAKLQAHVGTVVVTQFVFYAQPPTTDGSVAPLQVAVPLRVVGIADIDENDPYWHNIGFDPTGGQGAPVRTPALMPARTLLSIYDYLQATYPGAPVAYQAQPPELYWYYRLDPARISFAQFPDLRRQLAALQDYAGNTYGNVNDTSSSYPYLQRVDLYSPTLSNGDEQSTLETYASRVAVALIPVLIISLQVIALILFFVSMMAEFLVERQAESIAVLRSRGASRPQIFGSLFTQCLFLALIALVIGPLLSLLVVPLLGRSLLAPADRDAVSVISAHPLQALLDVRWYALVTVVVAILAMAFALYQATGADVLAIRRAAARTTRPPFWQRLYLDVLAALLALAAYGLSLYITTVGGALGVSSSALVTVPLTLVAPLFLLLGLILLSLRLYPLLLRWGARVAIHGRGAAPMLALAHMARSPRQAIRTTLLLALALAVAIFTLVFNATQEQQSRTIAAHQVGADFSGGIPAFRISQNQADFTRAYTHLPGVKAASVGYTASGNSEGSDPSIPVQVLAVDPSNFAQTTIWTEQDSPQPLTSWMQLLVAKRALLQSANAVPAIVDASAWNRLKLSMGATFSVKENNDVRYVVVGEVQHLPTVNDSLDTDPSSAYSTPGGVLVDYQTYDSYQMRASHLPLQPNYAWIHSADDAASLTSVRTALDSQELALQNLLDRRALEETLRTDPLINTVMGMLFLGGISALLLALVGNLFASWISARSRLTNFAVLRALGTAPGQIASVLTWEQAIVYGMGLLLGVLFGGWLSVTIVPTLVFSTIPTTSTNSDLTSGQFYALQHLFSTQLAIQPSLGLTLVGLVIVCVLALMMMLRTVIQPSLSQVLRLNED